jgi:Domain of unknown function (DUF5004)
MKSIHFLTIFFIAGLLFAGCRPDSYDPIGNANDNITAISGVWKLTKVTQTDAESQRKGFPYAVEDITTLFNYTTLQLTFNVANGAPAAFTINNGSAPPITGITSGTWAVDDIKAPKAITLSSGAASEIMTLGAYPNSVSNKLKVKVTRTDVATNKLLIVYDYEFSR